MTKAKTNQFQKIDIRGMDIGERAVAVRITLNNHTQQIELTTTPCNYGNVRYWFVCPCCKGRCAIVYLGDDGLACRKCYRLVYEIENETKADRAIGQAYKINHRLKFAGYVDCLGDKPKGMHWQTFSKLIAKRNAYNRVFFSHIGLWMERKFKIDAGVYYRFDTKIPTP